MPRCPSVSVVSNWTQNLQVDEYEENQPNSAMTELLGRAHRNCGWRPGTHLMFRVWGASPRPTPGGEPYLPFAITHRQPQSLPS